MIKEYSDMDNIFATAPYSTDGSTDADGNVVHSSARKFFDEFAASKYKGIFTFIPPKSWLDVDGYLTGEDVLQGYANFVLSGISWIRSFGITADLVEIFPEPDANHSYGAVYPKDLVIIANRLRDLSIARGITNPSVKVFGPALGNLLPANQDQELWTESFIFSRRSLDFFSIHANEHPLDALVYNSGTVAARKLVETRLRKSVTQMNSINVMNEKFVTSFSTRALLFPKTSYHAVSNAGDVEDTYDVHSEGGHTLITPHVLADSQEFSIRVLENLINILSSGFSSAFYESLSARVIDGVPVDGMEDSRSMRSVDGSSVDGSVREMEKLWSTLFTVFPLPGNIYRSEEINVEEDFTLKTCVMSTNGSKFCFILCRPVLPDALLGRLRLTVNNPLWSTNYEVKNLVITSYPAPASVTIQETTDEYGRTITEKIVGPGVDLSDVVMKATMNLNYMSLFVKGLPYGGCCLFITGDVILKEPIAPSPVPLPEPEPTPPVDEGEVPPDASPVLMQTIMQMPVNYGEPRFTNYPVGTVYYDYRDKTVKTFINGTWVQSTLLEYI